MIDNLVLEKYANFFRYKRLKADRNICFIKKVSSGFVILESTEKSKYVRFYLNKKEKIFKKSDLLMCTIENIPAGWEAENE